MRVLLAAFMGTLLLGGCSENGVPNGQTTSGSGGSAGAGGSGASGGAGGMGGAGLLLECNPDAQPPPAPSANFCARIEGGPPGMRPIAIDLSAAHAGVRFFSPLGEYADADQALAKALLPVMALESPEGPDLPSYAAALPGIVCAANAAPPQDLGPFQIEMIDGLDGVVLVRPGLGTLELPPGTKAVLVDLRNLPHAPMLRDAIEAAIAPALAKPIARPAARVRRHYGMTDELFSPFNLYKNTIAEIQRPPIPASGDVDLPLAILTSPMLPPEAADIAAALRIENRAWLVGEGLRIEVAEARWHGIGAFGLAHRQADLIDTNGNRLPDEIPADQRMAEPACIAFDLLDLGIPPPLAMGAADRPALVPVEPFGKKQPVDIDLGAARAALVVAHAASRTFFPYFGQVGDMIDDRLLETLDLVGNAAPERMDLRNILRRFSNALNDGHTIIRDFGSPKFDSFPAYIEDIDGEAVIRQTLAVDVNPGDTIVSIGGVPAAQWYATEVARTAAATDHYRFVIASFEYLRLLDPTQFELRDPDGGIRLIQFQPQPIIDLAAVGFTPTLRPAGWLSDLGAPNLYYINLTGEVLYDQSDFHTALTEAESAAGLVLDMRGYPGIDLSDVARRIIPGPWSGAIFRIPVLTGMDDRAIDEFADTFNPLVEPSYAGPVVLIVGHASLSAAEHFSMALVDAGRVTVVGRRSAGTNGNATGVQLPGSYAISFTGMDLRHADPQKSLFHGIGIVPDIEVPLSAAAFRDGVDPELDAAVNHLLMSP